MELCCFREKMKALHEKSGMDVIIDWPFVYDEDESGQIYIDANGVFHFADHCSNWVESPLKLGDIANLRYAKAFEEPGIDNDGCEPSESSICIHFFTGDYIWLHNHIDTYTVRIFVHLHPDNDNAQKVAKLKDLCQKSNSLEFTIS